MQNKEKIKIHTAQQHFFTKSYIYAKKIIDEKIIGNILFFEYKYSLNDQEKSWYWNKEDGGGCWLNVGWHMIFVIIWFFGIPQTLNVCNIKTNKRQWKYNTNDSTAFSCSYKNKLIGNRFVSVVDKFKEKTIRVIGDKGQFILKKNDLFLYDNQDNLIKEINGEEEQEIYENQILNFIKGGKRTQELKKYNEITTNIINSY